MTSEEVVAVAWVRNDWTNDVAVAKVDKEIKGLNVVDKVLNEIVHITETNYKLSNLL